MDMNKPVAWMSELGTCYSAEDIAEMSKNIADNFTIPLYTHPAGLTDEEIWKCVKQFTYAKYYDDFFKFAKKILRKAQEK